MKIIKFIYNIILTVYLFIFRKENENKEEIHVVHSMTFREYTLGGGGGGGIVLSIQKELLGNSFKQCKLKYSFFKRNSFDRMKRRLLGELFGGIEFAVGFAKREKNTAYITHDYAVAFGLYLLKKKYVLVSHLQGTRVEEKINNGENISFIYSRIIQYCENKSFSNAYYVCFPSKGAYDHFCMSEQKTILKENFKCGPVLYNTIYKIPRESIYKNLNLEKDKITFLSIGQLTIAKGVDRCLDFLKVFLRDYEKDCRWIIVGDGPLREKVLLRAAIIEKDHRNFKLIYIEKCNYAQMQYIERISDLYLMLHRVSIFDLSTLEMMKKGKGIILSRVGGNIEYNFYENIFYIEDDDYNNSVKSLMEKIEYKNLKTWGELNRKTYNEKFSNENFLRSYQNVLLDLLK